AIELNGVAADSNKLAFSLGRLAAADAAAVSTLLGDAAAPSPQDESIDALVARGVAHLTAYQDAAYAQRYTDVVALARRSETALRTDAALPFTRAVAQGLLKLMAYKDEYEVARLYTDGTFTRTLAQQFEGDVRLELYLAPPALSRARDGHAPRKRLFGPW